jgi:hypothetical protein
MSAISTAAVRLACLSLALTGSLAAPALAGFVGVSRCSLPGAPSQPALHIINGADRYLIPLGDNGLTTSILFDEHEAASWLAATGLFPTDTVFGNYHEFVCGLPVDEADPVVTEVAVIVPDPEDEEEDIIEEEEFGDCDSDYCGE